MKKKDFFLLGTIFKANGFDGELILSLDVDSTNKYKLLNEIYLEESGELKKHTISKYVLNKNKTANIIIENVLTKDVAIQFLKKEVWLPLSFLPPLSNKKFYYHEIVDFDVVDSICGDIGKAKSIIEMPHLKLLQVYKERTEILIPILENTIQKVDKENKVLEIETPEGLIDVYLNPNKKEKEDW